MSRNKVLFEAEGSRSDSTGGMILVVLGVVGGLTGLIVSIAIDGEFVGPWWIYALVLAASIGLGYYLFKKDAVKVKLEVDTSGQHYVTLQGPTTNLSFPFDFKFGYWYGRENVALKHGGGHFNRLSLVLESKTGERIAFFNRHGSDNAGPPGWDFRDNYVGEGDANHFWHYELLKFVEVLHRYHDKQTQAELFDES